MSDSPPDGHAALDGVLVIDVTRGEAGAAAGFALAQFGATVCMVEPRNGVALRAEAEALPRGEALWAAWHAGKRSFAVDLDSAAGRAQLEALVKRADILIEDSEDHLVHLLWTDMQVERVSTCR